MVAECGNRFAVSNIPVLPLKIYFHIETTLAHLRQKFDRWFESSRPF